MSGVDEVLATAPDAVETAAVDTNGGVIVSSVAHTPSENAYETHSAASAAQGAVLVSPRAKHSHHSNRSHRSARSPRSPRARGHRSPRSPRSGHDRTQLPFACGICGKGYSAADVLQAHFDLRHADDEKRRTAEAELARAHTLAAETIRRKLKKETALKEQGGEREVLEPATVDESGVAGGDEAEQYRCEECGKVYEAADILQAHKDIRHSPAGESLLHETKVVAEVDEEKVAAVADEVKAPAVEYSTATLDVGGKPNRTGRVPAYSSIDGDESADFAANYAAAVNFEQSPSGLTDGVSSKPRQTLLLANLITVMFLVLFAIGVATGVLALALISMVLGTVGFTYIFTNAGQSSTYEYLKKSVHVTAIKPHVELVKASGTSVEFSLSTYHMEYRTYYETEYYYSGGNQYSRQVLKGRWEPVYTGTYSERFEYDRWSDISPDVGCLDKFPDVFKVSFYKTFEFADEYTEQCFWQQYNAFVERYRYRDQCFTTSRELIIDNFCSNFLGVRHGNALPCWAGQCCFCASILCCWNWCFRKRFDHLAPQKQYYYMRQFQKDPPA